MLEISLKDGKYHLTYNSKTGRIEVCKFGEFYQLSTDNEIVLILMQRINDLQKQIEEKKIVK